MPYEYSLHKDGLSDWEVRDGNDVTVAEFHSHADASAEMRRLNGTGATSSYLNAPLRSEEEVRAHDANALFRAISTPRSIL